MLSQNSCAANAAQTLPSIGESKCNVFSLNNIPVVMSVDHSQSWTAPVWSQTADSSGLSTQSVFNELTLQVGRRDTPPAPVCHCCFWCHHGTAKPFLLSDREALCLQQKKMFNTRVFPALMTKLELKKHNSAYCVGIDLPPLSSLDPFCISIFTSLPSMAPRCQLQFPVFGSDYG